LAEDDGDREGSISPFPWSEVDDIPLPNGYEPTKCEYIDTARENNTDYTCLVGPLDLILFVLPFLSHHNSFIIVNTTTKSILSMDEDERVTIMWPIADFEN